MKLSIKSTRILTLITAGIALIILAASVYSYTLHVKPARSTPKPTPTATVVTATPSVLPTPTPLNGFSWYSNDAYNFAIQYPSGWTVTQQNPGTQFDFNDQILIQVQTPATSGVQANDPGTAQHWIDLEMENVRETSGDAVYHQLQPKTDILNFAGEQWQEEVALIQSNNTQLYVEVFATTYNNQVYIINFLTHVQSVNDFNSQRSQYLIPMLHSLTFSN